jgi:hypothetical protein
MNLADVLYTPLDVPTPPEIDTILLNSWLEENYQSLSKYKDIFTRASANTGEMTVDDYPWDLTAAYFNMTDNGPGWLGNFDIKFPELSKYFYESLSLTLDDIGFIILLPIRKDYKGFGFWHNDPDYTGLRMYLGFENEEQDKLYLKRTLNRVPISLTTLPKYQYPIDHAKYLQNEMIECKPISSRQCFYLNNFRSVHSTYTATPGTIRIAAFITGKLGQQLTLMKKINSLVVSSAMKYKDHSILWNY